MLIPHNDLHLNRELDLYTDRIYNVSGPQIIQARYSRIIGDVNRAPDELYSEDRQRAEGVIMLSLAEGFDTFAIDPREAVMQDWIARFHQPFHTEFIAAMSEADFIIDGHSYASVGAAAHIDPGRERCDISISNRQYSACGAETTFFFREYFRNLGYEVSINDPYPGRYILGTYANRLRTPGVQIEIKRSVYMNEETLEPYEDAIDRLHSEIQELVISFCAWYEVGKDTRPLTDMSE